MGHLLAMPYKVEVIPLARLIGAQADGRDYYRL
jgi:hypothetical protein